MTATAVGATRFNKLWGGQTISNFGDRITELALPVIAVVTLGVSPAEVGLLTAAVWTSNLLSLLVGSWVDRQAHRRRLLVVADVLRALVLLSLPIAHWLGMVTLAQLFAVALLAGVGQVLFNAAYPSFFVALVDRNRYVDANSKLSISRSASFVAGPALGGFLIQTLTAPIALLVDAASFLASALLISRIEVAPAAPGPSKSLMSDARAGLRYVLGHRYLRAGLACVTTINFFGLVAEALVVLFATRTLGLPVSLLGLALGVGALGGLAGATLAPRLSRRFGIGRMMLLGAFLFPAPTAALAFAGGPHWVCAVVLSAAEAVAGFGVMLLDINLNSVKTAVTADAMRSRVAGVFGTINYGVRPLGAALGGVLGGIIGVRPTLLIAAVGGVLGCLWLLASPLLKIRTLDRGPP
ncbi:MFS transporter [Winogradskya humida]|uniref:MFS transporter n=1 Tax=Winogradskya humida TaxID=113566 RepID=A0ABQ3ZP76_9ACTN|nr:MFS transporter [Actinoplanes humidus]GIE20389.1 MFS transporter [Actinoplanes humidus]